MHSMVAEQNAEGLQPLQEGRIHTLLHKKKSSGIETCMLTEWKGWELKGGPFHRAIQYAFGNFNTYTLKSTMVNYSLFKT